MFWSQCEKKKHKSLIWLKRRPTSIDEIRKLAPTYRRKAENFDPMKVGKKDAPPRPKDVAKRPGPTSGDLPPPTNPQTSPTPQRNESIISEAIFGIDVTVTEIAPRQEFTASYNRIIDVSLETYNNLLSDEKQLDSYGQGRNYATSLLWLKLVDVKAKEESVALTNEERAIRKG